MTKILWAGTLMSPLLFAAGITQAAQPLETLSKPVVDLRDTTVRNPTAYITSQCYTKTTGASEAVFNPCFTCHTRSPKPNYLDDSDLQLNYSFPGQALVNPWSNVFVDRGATVAAMSDDDVMRYVRTDNYRDADGVPKLRPKLQGALPEHWDLDGDGVWNGYVPDAYFRFDNEGFDLAPDGSETGWRAFAYYPFPGTFWPTNGSTDDVLIRLPRAFRTDSLGRSDRQVYTVNLAIIEALVKRADVAIEPVDENRFGLDLDQDGVLSQADTVVFAWAPKEGRFMSYVGAAGELQRAGELHLAAGLFPEGTEFLHSVRYLDPLDDGAVALAARMKELRYARKQAWYTYSELKGIAYREGAERALDADILKQVPGDFERGMFTQGWVYQGFIEDAAGELRPQSQEETLFCMGCHGGVGATTDTVFSFPRRFGSDAFQQGWYHWSQKGIQGVTEPKRGDGSFEYTRYLQVNGAGDEFRINNEVKERFFDTSGQLKQAPVAALHDDISLLLWPSRARALRLNKAYWAIVREQSFEQGRDATVTPATNVHRSVIQNQATGVAMPEL